MNRESITPWLLAHLVCPHESTSLVEVGDRLRCEHGHTFPVVQGIPVLLRADVAQTHEEAAHTLELAEEDNVLELLGVGPYDEPVNPHVQKLVGATSGFLYGPLLGRLPRYPIPDLRLPPGSGERLLDIGCNWGRWVIAAAHKGYAPVGLDPSLGAVLVAKQVCRQLGIKAEFVVGDARYLPFQASCFNQVFSYSVMQHLSKAHVRMSLAECRRVLVVSGKCLIQMPNRMGVRSLYHQARRRFREPRDFEVRYWSVGEIRKCFSEYVGPARVFVDGFFGLGIQPADIDLLPWRFKLVVRSSELLRRASGRLSFLMPLADSVYVEAISS